MLGRFHFFMMMFEDEADDKKVIGQCLVNTGSILGYKCNAIQVFNSSVCTPTNIITF